MAVSTLAGVEELVEEAKSLSRNQDWRKHDLYQDLVGVGKRVLPSRSQDEQARAAAQYIITDHRLRHDGNFRMLYDELHHRPSEAPALVQDFLSQPEQIVGVSASEYLARFRTREEVRAGQLVGGPMLDNWYRMQDELARFAVCHHALHELFLSPSSPDALRRWYKVHKFSREVNF